MAAVNPPYAIQALSTHSALGFRRMMGTFLQESVLSGTQPRGGVHPGLLSRCNVVGSASTMTATVNSGYYFIRAPGNDGVYHGYNNGAVNLTIDPADASQYRRDLVIARVQDTAYGDAINSHTIEVIKGTNNPGSPAPLPTQPARSLLLAIVNVDPGITNLSGKVSDQRTYIGGLGPTLCTSTTRPSNPHAGPQIYESDTGETRFYDGTAWRFIADTGWKTYTPTVTGGGTATWTLQIGRYKRVAEKSIMFSIFLDVNGAGSGSSNVQVALPSTPNRACRWVFPVSLESGVAISGAHGLVILGGSGAIIDRIRYAGASNLLGSDLNAGRLITISGVYEEA